MNSHRCNLWKCVPDVPTPKGLNVNKYGIDIINKIQPVIHFNKKSYNQDFLGTFGHGLRNPIFPKNRISWALSGWSGNFRSPALVSFKIIKLYI
jgi:hypothetical protein